MVQDTLFFEKNEHLFFTADTHFGHRNIIKYCQRPYTSVEEMEETIIANWNSVVDKDDLVFHLGDFAMGGSKEWSRLLQRLNGRIHLILGNHDVQTIRSGVSSFEGIAMQMMLNVQGQKIYLNHYPFLCYSGSSRNTWQLFGHVHTCSNNNGKDSSRLKMLLPTQYDVGVDNNNYTPVSFDQIKATISKQVKLYEQKLPKE